MADEAFAAVEKKVAAVGETGDLIMDAITDLSELASAYLALLDETLNQENEESHVAMRRAVESIGGVAERDGESDQWLINFPQLEQMLEKTQESVLWAILSLRREYDQQLSSQADDT